VPILIELDRVAKSIGEESSQGQGYAELQRPERQKKDESPSCSVELSLCSVACHDTCFSYSTGRVPGKRRQSSGVSVLESVTLTWFTCHRDAIQTRLGNKICIEEYNHVGDNTFTAWGLIGLLKQYAICKFLRLRRANRQP
jgi:hypothetical protein